MEEENAKALAKASLIIYTAAREHKRASEHHRRQARDLMRQLADLRRSCDALGITLEVDTGKEPQ